MSAKQPWNLKGQKSGGLAPDRLRWRGSQGTSPWLLVAGDLTFSHFADLLNVHHHQPVALLLGT